MCLASSQYNTIRYNTYRQAGNNNRKMVFTSWPGPPGRKERKNPPTTHCMYVCMYVYTAVVLFICISILFTPPSAFRLAFRTPSPCLTSNTSPTYVTSTTPAARLASQELSPALAACLSAYIHTSTSTRAYICIVKARQTRPDPRLLYIQPAR